MVNFDPENKKNVFDVQGVSVFYGKFEALRNVSMQVPQQEVTAFIGPSGCGKSTLLRCFNRLNDLIPQAKVQGQILYEGKDLYAPKVDSVEVRQKIGMVFQKPNPFPKSIYDNIAYGARINGYRGNMDELVERCINMTAFFNVNAGDDGKRSAI